MTTKTTRTVLAATALAGVLALTGCAASETPAPASSPAAATSTAPTEPAPTAAETTPAPTPALAVGAPVTDPAILAACDPAKLPLGIIDYGTEAGQCTLSKTQRVYVQADGTAVLVDKDQPLPAPVLQELTGKVAAAVPADNVENRSVVLDSAEKALAAAATATGMTTVAIIKVLGAPCGSDAVNIPVYIAFRSGGRYLHSSGCAAFATPDEALADAQAILGAAGPTGWVVLPYAG